MHQETLQIVPNIAAGYDVADDGFTVTLELRPETRWSNGDPFIVDVLMFVMEDMKWDDRVDPGWRAGETPATAVSLTRIDDHTMQLHMSQIDYVVIPGWTFELEIAQWAEVDLRVVPRLVDAAAWSENIAAADTSSAASGSNLMAPSTQARRSGLIQHSPRFTT